MSIESQKPSSIIEFHAVAPAKAEPYIGTAKRGLNIYKSPDEGPRAIEYAKQIFPNSNFTYLDSGRYGIVLSDDTGKAFKVYRDSLHYSKYEREAGALQLLSNAGLAPKLHLFVDADEEYRLDRNHFKEMPKKGFEEVPILRQNGGKDLPILVMDKVNASPLETAEPAQLAAGFCKALDLFIKESILPWDSEPIVNTQNGEILFLDVGELSQASLGDLDKDSIESRILNNTILDFGLTYVGRHIKRTYSEGGLEGVYALLVDRRPS